MLSRKNKILLFSFTLTLIISIAKAEISSVDDNAIIKGKTIQLHVDRAAGIIINRYCHKTNGKYDCQAIKALAHASFVEVIIKGGANPGAIICLKLGGRVVLSVDRDRNENSYCQFKDGSLAASGSIAFHARKNDEDRAMK